MLVKTKNEVILYTGKPLMLPAEEASEDIVVSSVDSKYNPGVISLQTYFKGDEDSLVEIELNRDMIKALYDKYCK